MGYGVWGGCETLRWLSEKLSFCYGMGTFDSATVKRGKPIFAMFKDREMFLTYNWFKFMCAQIFNFGQFSV